MPPALARVGDDITHANASLGAGIGGGLGLLGGIIVGAVIGAAIVTAAIAAGPVLVIAGAALLAVGGSVALGGMFGKIGAHIGAHIGSSGPEGPPKGKISTGSRNVYANGRRVALACSSEVACQDHPGPVPISQGSKTVFVNGHGAARIGDRGVCGFFIRKAEGNGSPDVFVGGDPSACHGLPVGNGTPQWMEDYFSTLEKVGGGMALAGLTLMTLGGGLAAASAAGLTMTARLGASIVGQTIARVGAQVALGYGLTQAGGYAGSLIGGALTGGDPFWTQTGGEIGGAVLPFGGGRGFKAVNNMPWRMPRPTGPAGRVPGDPHTPESIAQAEAQWAATRQRWRNGSDLQGPPGSVLQPVPAAAGGAPRRPVVSAPQNTSPPNAVNMSSSNGSGSSGSGSSGSGSSGSGSSGSGSSGSGGTRPPNVPVPDWTPGTPAATLIAGGRQVSGKFPDKAGANDVLYRRSPQTGDVTHYQVYDNTGKTVKRVDITGDPHGGVPTPHVTQMVENVNPKTGQTFRNKLPTVRPANPDEVP